MIRGLVYDQNDVFEILRNMGGTVDRPISCMKIMGYSGSATISGPGAWNEEHFGSYFFRGASSATHGWTSTDPTTAGQALPFFFGRSVCRISVGSVTLPARIVVTEYLLARAEVNSGTDPITRMSNANPQEGDVYEIESLNDCTRYWSVQFIVDAGGAMNVSRSMLWNGWGGIEKYSV